MGQLLHGAEDRIRTYEGLRQQFYRLLHLTTLVPRRVLEPPLGFEPRTHGLQNRCSATELRWQPNSHGILSLVREVRKPFVVYALACLTVVWLNNPAMSRVCEICGKGRLKGNLVPRGIGRRVTHRSIHNQQPNLREKRVDIGGRFVKLKLCTTCLGMLNKSKKEAQAQAR